MRKQEQQVFVVALKEAPGSKELRMKVEDCSVTLRFPCKTQGHVMAEVKRMILTGHSYTRM